MTPPMPHAKALDLAAAKHRALGHPERLLILTATNVPKTLDELAAITGMTRQAVAKHVHILRQAGLLQERQGKRSRTVKEFVVDAAEAWLLANDLARLIERPKVPDLHAPPTVDLAAGGALPATVRHRPGILVLRGPTMVASLALSRGERWTIGRAQRCDIPLEDKRVSQQHAVIRRQGEAYLLADLESRNGTWVNGFRLAPGTAVRLGPGDVVRVGDTVLVVG
jgi:biotin operon repressor